MEDHHAETSVYVVVAPVYGTNCYVLRQEGDCVIVDAGGGVADDVMQLIDAMGVRPQAILATHGHADHTWDAATLVERYRVPFVLHEADEYRIHHPLSTIDAPGASVSESMAAGLRGCGLDPDNYQVPSRIEPFNGVGDVTLAFGAVQVRAVPAPGHTEGSTLYLVGEPHGGSVLTGDVLFAGTIGRTDLPGGDGPTMGRTLRDVVSRLDPQWQVRPGHGPASTMGRELAVNPFLAR